MIPFVYKLLAVIALAGALLTGAYVKGRINGAAATEIKWQAKIAKAEAEWEARQRQAQEEANNELNRLLNEKEAADALLEQLRREAEADPAAAGGGITADSVRRIARLR